MFTSNLRMEKVHGASKKYFTTSPLVYKDVNDVSYTVPANFRTDLSTYYFEGRHTPSAILHDWALKETNMSRKEVDYLMLRAMRSETENCRWLNVVVVRIGLFVWRTYLRAESQFPVIFKLIKLIKFWR